MGKKERKYVGVVHLHFRPGELNVDMLTDGEGSGCFDFP